MPKSMANDAERMKRGECTKQSLWDEGYPYYAIEAVAAMADGVPELFAQLILRGYSRDAVEKRVADILNGPLQNTTSKASLR